MDPEALLAEAGWLKRLAVTLAGDGDDADDLVQESWITAWRRNPDVSQPLRPWLAKVLRDHSRMRRRADSRRMQREAAVPEMNETVAPDDLLDQVRLHRLLVDLVLELDEPYRSTVLARFVEGQTSAAIAKRLDVPESTVRWRLREALARLRTRLDDVNGDRKNWSPAVLAFARKGVTVADATKKVMLLIALIALLLGGVVLLVMNPGSGDPSSTGVTTSGSGAARVHVGVAKWKLGAFAELRTDQRPPGWFAQEGVKPRRISGTVRVDGAPASGALVRLEDEASRVGLVSQRQTRTAADGRFDFGVQPATRYDVGAYLPGRVATIRRVDLRDPRLDSEHVVVVLEPCVVGLYGKVVDASGGPIAQAQLLAQGVIGTESDANGSFDICLNAQGHAPDDRRLVVRASGYGTVEIIAPLVGRVRHHFMLSPEATISGRVLNAKGEPVAMANVRVNWDEAAPRPGTEQPAVVHAVSDANGRFELSALAPGRLRIQALARGAASTPTIVDVRAGASKEIQLTVSERGVLRGRVLSGGRPVAGVAVFDRAELPTYQARSQITSRINEAVSQEDGTFVLDGLSIGTLSLGTSPYRLRSPASIRISPGEQSVDLDVEQLGSIVGTVRRKGKAIPNTLVGTSGTKWTNRRTTESDETGRFVFDDLAADEYLLFGHSPAAGAFVNLDKRIRVEPGTRTEMDVELRYGASISGSVVDTKGSPVAGAFVNFDWREADDLSNCTTDAAGRFRCTAMTGGGAYRVRVAASEASAKPYDFVGTPPEPIFLRDGDAHVDDLRLSVDARTLRVTGTVVDRADQPIADARVFVNAPEIWASVPTSVTNLRGEFELRDLSPGSYGLLVIGEDGSRTLVEGVAAGTTGVRLVLDAAKCDDSIDAKLGRVQREAPSSIAHRPPTRVVWDERIELLGWDVPPRRRVGEPFQILLVYKVLEPIDRSWKIFIHLDGPKQRVNADHEPLGGRCPTSTWKPGDVIIDRTSVRVDPRFDAGKYDVWIGFFGGLAPNWKNLSLSIAPEPRHEHHRFKLTSVDIEK
ncbi:MAG: sigma-70 family RNA polymerase sigma factor [Deltaproteobacteria bacterium]|nr:sigma-70 family RNA polymerase sigma factor [Deltaproteobacteria bacterium]